MLTGIIAFSTVLGADANYPTGTRGLLLIDKVGSYIGSSTRSRSRSGRASRSSTKPHDFVLTADPEDGLRAALRRRHLQPQSNPGHEVVIVDMDAAKVVGSIDTSPYRAPHGFKIGPDGTIYVASDLDRGCSSSTRRPAR